MGNSERYVATTWDWRDSQQPWETVRAMQQLYGTGIDSERQPANVEERKRYAATAWHWRDSERQPANMVDSRRQVKTQ